MGGLGTGRGQGRARGARGGGMGMCGFDGEGGGGGLGVCCGREIDTRFRSIESYLVWCVLITRFIAC